jgi:hypothetical protein
VLKRKERELEYEMERLAKEKITAQNRILFLKRELSSFDIDCTKLTAEVGGTVIGGNNSSISGIIDLHAVKQERGEYTMFECNEARNVRLFYASHLQF